MTTLTGSESQVAWAEQIRAKALETLAAVDPAALVSRVDSELAKAEKRIAETEQRGAPAHRLADLQKWLASARAGVARSREIAPRLQEILERQTAAKWWIDHKQTLPQRITPGLPNGGVGGTWADVVLMMGGAHSSGVRIPV